MNTKVLAGFLAGVIAASGVFYVISHRHRGAAPIQVIAAAASVPVSAAVPVVAPTPVEPVSAPVAVTSLTPRHKPINPALVASAAQMFEPEVQPDPSPALPVAYSPLVALPQSVPAIEPPHPPAAVPPPADLPKDPSEPNTATVASGTTIDVRLSGALSSKRNQAGDVFTATLVEPLVADGFIIAARGARVEGRISEVKKAGRVKGVAQLTLELTQISTSDGQNVAIHTAPFEKQGERSLGDDAGKIAAGTVLGTVAGAVGGGGKGAAIGAAAGTAVGVAGVMLTRGNDVELRSEFRISFQLDQPVTLTEKLKQ